MSLSVRVCLWAVAVCLLLDVTIAGSKCSVGSACTCNSEIVNLNKPGETPDYLKVCCPPADGVQCSKYLSAGNATVTSKAYCTCLFTRIQGNCLRGSQCLGKDSSVTYNDMPLCCNSVHDKITSIKSINGTKDLDCHCSNPSLGWTGNCWKGSQCTNCYPDYSESAYDFPLCCPNCARRAVTINSPEKTCYCSSY